MKLDLQVGTQPIEDGSFLVVDTREVLELDIAIRDVQLPERPRWQVMVRLDGQPLPVQEELQKANLEVTFAARLEVRPLPHSVWATSKLTIEVRLDDAVSDHAPTSGTLELLLIPATHARAARGLLFVCLGLSLLIAWPAFAAEPVTSWDGPSKVVFGAPLLGLVVDELRKRVKVGLGMNGGDAMTRQWTFLGLRPLLAWCALAGVSCVVVFALLTRYFVVTYVNTAGHTLSLRWDGATTQALAADASTTRLSSKPHDLFTAALTKDESLRDICLEGWDEHCSSPEAQRSNDWSKVFALSRVIDIACREYEWSGMADKLTSTTTLDGSELTGGRLLVKSNPADCGPVRAAAWFDADKLETEAGRRVANVSRSYQMQYDAAATAVPDLGKFIDVSVTIPTDNVRPVTLESKGAGVSSFLATRSTIQRVETAEHEMSGAMRGVVAMRVPARSNAHHLDWVIGPSTTSAWGTLNCFPRNHARLNVWLLPLTDSSVVSFQVESGGVIVSNWTATNSNVGETSPIVAVCLPEGEADSPRIDIGVAPWHGVWDPPQLTLPSQLKQPVITLTSTEAGKPRRVGLITCKSAKPAASRLVRAPGLQGPATTNDLSVCYGVGGKACHSSSTGQDSPDMARSTWRGESAPLLCLPEPLQAKYEVAPGWGSFPCSFAPDTPTKPCSPPPAKVCEVNEFGIPTSCECETWDTATRFLTAQERQTLKDVYACNPATTKVCTACKR